MKTTTAPTTAAPILLSEDRDQINLIDRTAKQWLENLNAVIDAWTKLEILTPFSTSILIEQDFREWFFSEQQRVNPILKSINMGSYVFPPEVETIQRVSDWLRHEDTKIHYLAFVKYIDGKFELNHDEIERIKNERARSFAVSPENQQALQLAENAERSLNALFEFLESGINGDRHQRINFLEFLHWVDVPTGNGSRARLKLKRELFKESKSPMPTYAVEGLIQEVKRKNKSHAK